MGPISCYHSWPEWTWEQWQWRSTPHSPKLQHYWNLTIRLFSVISRTLVRGSYPSAEKQSVYSTVLSDGASAKSRLIIYWCSKYVIKADYEHSDGASVFPCKTPVIMLKDWLGWFIKTGSLVWWVECSPMVQETWVQSRVASYERL